MLEPKATPVQLSYAADALTFGSSTSLPRFIYLHSLLALSLLALEVSAHGHAAVVIAARGACVGAMGLMLGGTSLLRTRRPQEQHLVQVLLVVTLILVVIAMNAVWLDLSPGAPNELTELTLLQLSCYALLVPTFPLRVVAPATAGLSVLQPLILIASTGTRAYDMLARELIKSVAFNAFGLALAWTAEHQHKNNHALVKQFNDESERNLAAQKDVQRLLLATLPAPVVHEIAVKGGRAKCAHRYEDVTVLQADIVGFTALSATLDASELLTILGEKLILSLAPVLIPVRTGDPRSHHHHRHHDHHQVRSFTHLTKRRPCLAYTG